MPQTYWSAPAGPMGVASGPAVTAAALTDASPLPQVLIQAGQIQAGTEMRVRAHGELTSTSATPTVIWSIIWNTPGAAIGSGVVLAATAAQAISASATAWPWMLEWDGEFRSLSTALGGNTGSINGMGRCFPTGTSLTTFGAVAAFPTTKALRTVSLDTSVTKTVQLGVTLSVTTGTPSVTCDDLIVELLG